MDICVFSKHLQALDFKELGKTLKKLGVNGVDLTVRRGGHVEPSEVRDKLPLAKDALSKEGVKITMITTEIIDIDQPDAKDVLETASQLGIGYFKLGYYLYQEFGSLKRLLQEANAKMKDISVFCEEHRIKGGYHNHSGDCLAASVPHVLDMLDGCSNMGMGVYYDIGHAVIEGGLSGWKMNLDQVADRLFMVAAKDLCFTQKECGEKSWPWDVNVVPMGSGLVNWQAFLKYLKSISFDGPFSMHSEYSLPVDEIVAQTERDLSFLRKLL